MYISVVMYLSVCVFTSLFILTWQPSYYISFFLSQATFTLIQLYLSLSVYLFISVYSPWYISIFHCLPICSSQSIYLAVSPSIILFTSVSLCLFIYLTTYHSICLFIYIPVCQSIRLFTSVCPVIHHSTFVRPSVCLHHPYIYIQQHFKAGQREAAVTLAVYLPSPRRCAQIVGHWYLEFCVSGGGISVKCIDRVLMNV